MAPAVGSWLTDGACSHRSWKQNLRSSAASKALSCGRELPDLSSFFNIGLHKTTTLQQAQGDSTGACCALFTLQTMGFNLRELHQENISVSQPQTGATAI